MAGGGGAPGAQRRRLVLRPVAAALASTRAARRRDRRGTAALGATTTATAATATSSASSSHPVVSAAENAGGTAELRPEAGGRATVELRGLRPSGPRDFYELWLLGDDGELVSLGSVRVPDSGDATLDVELPVDPKQFRYLDLSREPDDGDPSHSTISILRGPVVEPDPGRAAQRPSALRAARPRRSPAGRIARPRRQPLDLVAVDPRPVAARPARREALQEVDLVERLRGDRRSSRSRARLSTASWWLTLSMPLAFLAILIQTPGGVGVVLRRAIPPTRAADGEEDLLEAVVRAHARQATRLRPRPASGMARRVASSSRSVASPVSGAVTTRRR